jgi:hypothetical protein
MEPAAKAGSACDTGLFKDNILFNGLGHGRYGFDFGVWVARKLAELCSD